jgi:hypothetical protein
MNMNEDTDEREEIAIEPLPCVLCGKPWCYIHDDHLADCPCSKNILRELRGH